MLPKSINFISIDLIDIRKDLNNLMEIYNFIDSILQSTNLKPVNKPVLIPYYYGKIKENCGISCYQFLKGGYCTFHVFEERRIAYFDIMSHDAFDKLLIIDKLTKFCHTKKIIINTPESTTLSNENIFGPHFVCVGRTEKDLTLDDMLKLQNYIIKGIKMTPIISPTIMKNGKQTLMFIAIAESHIAITVTGRTVQIDIFSCKMFDINILKKVLTKVITIKNEKLFQRLYKI